MEITTPIPIVKDADTIRSLDTVYQNGGRFRMVLVTCIFNINVADNTALYILAKSKATSPPTSSVGRAGIDTLNNIIFAESVWGQVSFVVSPYYYYTISTIIQNPLNTIQKYDWMEIDL